jgi:hypothetical protein
MVFLGPGSLIVGVEILSVSGDDLCVETYLAGQHDGREYRGQ